MDKNTKKGEKYIIFFKFVFPWQMWPKHNNCVELTQFFPHLFFSGMWVTWGMPLIKVWLWYLLKISFLKWGEYIFFKAILLLFNLFFGTNWALPSIWLIWDPKYYTFLESSWQNIQENHIIKVDAYIKVGKIFLLTCPDWDVPISSHCVLSRLHHPTNMPFRILTTLKQIHFKINKDCKSVWPAAEDSRIK